MNTTKRTCRPSSEELYLADLRLDTISASTESSIMDLLGRCWRQVYIAGDHLTQRLDDQQLSALLSRRRRMMERLAEFAEETSLVVVWDRTSLLSRAELAGIFPGAAVVTNQVVECMVDHANKYDNKFHQTWVWFAKPALILPGIVEVIEYGIASFIERCANRRPRDGLSPLETRVSKAYAHYQHASADAPGARIRSDEACTYFRW